MCLLAEEEQQNYDLGDGDGDGKFINMILVQLKNIKTTAMYLKLAVPQLTTMELPYPPTHYYGVTLFRKSMSVAYLSTATATTV